MEETQNRKLDKYAGAILGAAAGDALGWPYEQNSKKYQQGRAKRKGNVSKMVKT